MWLSKTRRRFYLLHIPKTAGSTLTAVLLSHYPQREILKCLLPELLQMRREEINDHQAFAGHWGRGFSSLLDRQISCLTVLRDPFERTISTIHFAQRENLPREHPEIQAVIARGDLHEIVEHPFVQKMFGCMQAFHLGCFVDLNEHLASPPPGVMKSSETLTYLEYKWATELQAGLVDKNAVVAEAKRQVDRIEVVGIFEQLQETTRLACDYLGIQPPPVLPRKLMSPERTALATTSYRDSGTIPADVVRKIDELTAADREVYDHARHRWARELASRRRRHFWPFG